MNRNIWACGLLATAMITGLALSGCGEGDATSASSITRELFAGAGPASGSGVTTKYWKVVAIKGNSKYQTISGGLPFSGGGGVAAPIVDIACAATLTDPNDANQTLTCGTSDIVAAKSDGTFTFKGVGKTWALDGSALTLDYGSAFGLQTSTLTLETVAGKQRIRIHQNTLTKGGVRMTHDDDSEVVIEETTVSQM